MYTEANTCLYTVKWVYTRRQTRLHEKTNSFPLYLVSDVYCMYTTCILYNVHVHVYLEGGVQVSGVARHDEKDHGIGATGIVLINEGPHQIHHPVVLRQSPVERERERRMECV